MTRPLLLALLLAAVLPADGAQATATLSITGFGGVSIPIGNDVPEPGTQFGIRVPVGVLPWLAVEPYFASSALGEEVEDFGTGTTYTRDGGDVTAFGVNARFFGASAAAVRFYPFVGIGTYKATREGSNDADYSGLQAGAGVGFSPKPRFWIDLRGELTRNLTEVDSEQTFGNVTLGVTYDIVGLP